MKGKPSKTFCRCKRRLGIDYKRLGSCRRCLLKVGVKLPTPKQKREQIIKCGKCKRRFRDRHNLKRHKCRKGSPNILSKLPHTTPVPKLPPSIAPIMEETCDHLPEQPATGEWTHWRGHCHLEGQTVVVKPRRIWKVGTGRLRAGETAPTRGVRMEDIPGVATDGFKLHKRSLWGDAIYFTTHRCKATQFARGASKACPASGSCTVPRLCIGHGDQPGCILICGVMLGNVYQTKDRNLNVLQKPFSNIALTPLRSTASFAF